MRLYLEVMAVHGWIRQETMLVPDTTVVMEINIVVTTLLAGQLFRTLCS